ncbi:MAG TPA: N-acyl homoserine lactonase family protein [Bryobacteraceae bacterium]|jgi:glyoxylase-like metal-dependent hydrolase (beta-lactamase superfamily II)
MNVLLAAIVAALSLAAQQKAPSKKPQAPKSVRLYVLNCGSLNPTDVSAYTFKKEELATTLMSVPCFLVVHPKGTLAWDVGAVPDTAFKSDGSPGTLRYATMATPLKKQMAEIGYAPSDVTYLALSHFHWDHVGNSNLFAGSTWLVTKVERDTMFAEPPSPRTEAANFAALKTAKTKYLTTKDYDVFGDGTVVIKAAPGHSPGHQVLFLKLAKTGPVVLSGDLYHYPEERKFGRVPTTEFDGAQTAASRKEIEAFLQKTGAQLWIQHDFIATQKLKRSPEFYE